MSASELIDAASVLILRDSAQGPEVLLTRRAAGMKNFADAWVFPGGREDPEDATPLPSEQVAGELSAEELCWRRSNRAAVRETFEETGLRLAHDALVAWSHWLPPPVMAKRFNTRFFIGPALANAELNADAREVLEVVWLTPTEAARRARHGELLSAPPTQVNLYELEQCAEACTSVEAIMANARSRQFITICARLDRDGENFWSVFPWDKRYAQLEPGGAPETIPARYHALPSRMPAARFMRLGTTRSALAGSTANTQK